MKIISKFKDYYDRTLALGQDDRIPYIRLTEEIPYFEVPSIEGCPRPRSSIGISFKKENPKYPGARNFTWGSGHFYLCGKTYRYVRFDIDSSWVWVDGEQHYHSGGHEYVYTYEQFCSFVESTGNLVKDIYGRALFGERPRYAQIEAFLSAQGTTEAEKAMVEHRVVLARKLSRPIQGGSVYGTELFFETNFPLKELQFFKLMDPYQVYQELDMYVCGVLGRQEKEVVKVSDKDRIYQHGFDKYSFRKMPEEGKKRK